MQQQHSFVLSLWTGYTWFWKGSCGAEVPKSCSCSARKALCNHIVALLCLTAHYSTVGFKTVGCHAPAHCRPGTGLRHRSDINICYTWCCWTSSSYWLLSINCLSLLYYRELHQRLQMTWWCVNQWQGQKIMSELVWSANCTDHMLVSLNDPQPVQFECISNRKT